jgi:hypothetical protein
MRGVMGEGFIDHQYGITTALPRLPARGAGSVGSESGMVYPEAATI